MIRSFLAIPIPDETADALEDVEDGLGDAHWQPRENFHLTLVFLGAQDRRTLEDIDAALITLSAPPLEIALKGLGVFGGAEGRLLYAAVAENPALRRLQAKVETAARAAGVAVADRRYTPHVTLARWGRRALPAGAAEAFAAEHGLFSAPPFTARACVLYRSELGRHGARYEAMARYPFAPEEPSGTDG